MIRIPTKQPVQWKVRGFFSWLNWVAYTANHHILLGQQGLAFTRFLRRWSTLLMQSLHGFLDMTSPARWTFESNKLNQPGNNDNMTKHRTWPKLQYPYMRNGTPPPKKKNTHIERSCTSSSGLVPNYEGSWTRTVPTLKGGYLRGWRLQDVTAFWSWNQIAVKKKVGGMIGSRHKKSGLFLRPPPP